MKWLSIFFTLFINFSIFAEEAIVKVDRAVPEVGKHVAGNMDATTMILSLLLVLLLIVGSASVLKKFNFANTKQSNGLKVVTSLHLGTKEKLIVVQVGEKQVLLGVTQQQINMLDTLDKPIEAVTPANQKFTESLQKLLNKSS